MFRTENHFRSNHFGSLCEGHLVGCVHYILFASSFFVKRFPSP